MQIPQHDSVRRLTMRALINSWSGYGILALELFHWFSRNNIFVSVRPTSMDVRFGATIPTSVSGAIVHTRQPEAWELLVHTPEMAVTPERKTAYFTMWECTELAPKYLRALNQSEIVIVPCRWNQKHFIENGVTKPVHVVPLGVDPDIFYPAPIRTGGPCVFGAAGRPAHCAKRKGIRAVIDLFIKTFPNNDDVRLQVKVTEDANIGEIKDPRIKVIREFMEPHEISHWLQGLTAFVSLARAEGYGLWQLQSLACGRPVIACQYSGLADFLPSDLAVPFREVSADGEGSDANVEYMGFWAEPKESVAASHMLNVYRLHKKRSDDLTALSQRAAAAAAPLTWKNSAQTLIAVLRNAGVWS